MGFPGNWRLSAPREAPRDISRAIVCSRRKHRRCGDFYHNPLKADLLPYQIRPSLWPCIICVGEVGSCLYIVSQYGPIVARANMDTLNIVVLIVTILFDFARRQEMQRSLRSYLRITRYLFHLSPRNGSNAPIVTNMTSVIPKSPDDLQRDIVRRAK